jgi:hypothetical protein
MKLLNLSLLLLPITLLPGCSGTWNYVDKPGLTIVGTDTPARDAVGGLFTRLNAPFKITLCEADKISKNCLKNEGGISARGFGGIGLPLFLDMTGIELSKIAAEDDIWVFDSTLDAQINEIPTWCGNVSGEISTENNQNAHIEQANFYCNWAVIGNVLTNIDLAIETINSTENSFTGYYKISFIGTGNGAGSGYFKASVVPTEQAKP